MGFDKATLKYWRRTALATTSFEYCASWHPRSLGLARERPSWCHGNRSCYGRITTTRATEWFGGGVAPAADLDLLVLAIDLPRISAEHLRKLCDLARPGSGVIPLNGDYFEPLCAIYPVEAGASAQAALISDDVSLQHFGKPAGAVPRANLCFDSGRTSALSQLECSSDLQKDLQTKVSTNPGSMVRRFFERIMIVTNPAKRRFARSRNPRPALLRFFI